MITLKAIIDLVGGVRASVWLAAALLLALLLGVSRCQLRTERASNESDATTISNYEAANKSNVDAIAILKAANQRWAEAYDYDLLANETAIIGLRKDNEVLTKALTVAAQERKAIYAKYPQARAWGRTGADARIIDSLLDDTKAH